MHADADCRGSAVDDRADLIEAETGAIAQRQQVLLLRPQASDERMEFLGSLAFEDALLRGRVHGRPLFDERLRGALTLHVADRVAGDLKQPAGEAAIAAEATKLLKRRGEHVARHVLARGAIPDPQTRVAEDPIEVAVIQPQELT